MGAQLDQRYATLDTVSIGSDWIVEGLTPPDDAPEWESWLDGLGFVRGERVSVLNRALLSGDRLVVRIGTSTYALRRAEAACVRVAPA
jgi:ferrous iron transport protein A